MLRSVWGKPVFTVLLFGILAVVFGRMQLDIPGTMGLKSNFVEVALITSLPFLTAWPMALAAAAFTVFNVAPDGSLFADSFNHVVGMLFLYIAYPYIKTVKHRALYVMALIVTIAAYYYLFLLPVHFGIHLLDGGVNLAGTISAYRSTSEQVVFEWLVTTAVCVFFFLMYREYETRLLAQADTEKMNGELQTTLQKLKVIAFLDAATGLPNGLQFERDVADLVPGSSGLNGQKLALFGFRIKGLESLNQEKGLEVASKVIARIFSNFNEQLLTFYAKRQQYRPPESLQTCYRIDASILVFMLSLPSEINAALSGLNDGSLKKIIQAEMLCYDMTSPLDYQGGFTVFPDDAQTFDQLQRNLLTVLHADNNVNHGQFVAFNPEQYNKQQRQELLRQNMAQAIRDKEFFMVFQPKVDIEAGRICGYEGLARWRSVSLGNISPVEFIPIAERFFFIEELTQLLLGDAYRFIETVRSEGGEDFRVSVNISPDLLHAEFLDGLRNDVVRENIHHYLELEITESTVASMAPMAIESFQYLKRMGVSIAIDDFGTGYSNLVFLQKFEPNVLKIDKSFIDGIPADINNCKLTKAVLDIAETFNLKVVAEGVEYAEQASFLKVNGCRVIQGYFYAKPMEFEAALDFSRNSPYAILPASQ